MVTLNSRSSSPKSNQLFPSSQQCTYAGFVKIHLLVQKITHKRLIYTVFIGWWPWKLSKGHQNLINSFHPPNNVSMQVSSKSPTGSEDNTRKRSYIDTNTIHTKNSMSHPSLRLGEHYDYYHGGVALYWINKKTKSLSFIFFYCLTFWSIYKTNMIKGI